MAEQADSRHEVLAGRQSWRVRAGTEAWASLALPAVPLLAAALLAVRWRALPLGPLSPFLALAALLALGLSLAAALRVWSCLSLRYTIDDENVTLVRGLDRWSIPLAAITRVGAADELARPGAPWFVPGFAIGRGFLQDDTHALFLAARPLPGALVIEADGSAYVITPTDADAFTALLQERRPAARPGVLRPPGRSPLRALAQPASIVLAGLAIIANCGLFALIAWWLPVLPEALPSYRLASGASASWASPTDLWRLPSGGAIIILISLLLPLLPWLRRPLLAVVLLASALAAQVFLWTAFLAFLP